MMLIIPVYRTAGADTTNGGISSRKDYLTDDDVYIETRPQWGDKIIVPRVKHPELIGPMFGGNIGEIDGKYYRIHDRFETQEEYDVLSR